MTDIRFNSEYQKYLLVLPEAVVKELKLMNSEGQALAIGHENKMQLEWLSQRISNDFESHAKALTMLRNRLRTKKTIVASIIIVVVVLAFFRKQLAEMLHLNQMYFNLPLFAIGMISLLQFLKYLAQGYAGIPEQEAELDDLKETIENQFSLA